MTALHALRMAASEQPEGALKSLLNWAELHIGDQFERICELEDDLKQADAENQRRANALNAIRAALGELGEVILKENFSWPSDAIAKDLSSWRNVLDVYGFKPDGSVKKIKPKKDSA
jgi:hypothetical protein